MNFGSGVVLVVENSGCFCHAAYIFMPRDKSSGWRKQQKIGENNHSIYAAEYNSRAF